MSSLFFKFIFHTLLGWKIVGNYPHDVKKMVIVIGPHTSLWDYGVGVCVRNILKFKSSYLVKAELYKNPIMAKFLTWMDGIPVDRGNKNADVVGSVVKVYKERDYFVLAITPEGTRSKVRRLKTGFYRIALAAEVPILIAGFDFKKKEVAFDELFHPTGNMEKDIDYIMNYFKRFEGKNPELGLS